MSAKGFQTPRLCLLEICNFLNKVESLLNSNGDYLFGRHSVTDLHFVPYLFRIIIVHKPEQVFENGLALKAYYERAQVRPTSIKLSNKLIINYFATSQFVISCIISV